MKKQKTAAPFLPRRKSLPAMRKAVQNCRGCDLYKNATQAVFGEGPARARLMVIGEQPGDHEDQEGHPFVGPAGRMLNEILEEAGIDRNEVYVTNAVKHFKWSASGKRRIHSKPVASEVRACAGWLENELRVVRPDVIVCLGATAVYAIFDRNLPVLANRRRWMKSQWSDHTTVTVHPSFLLRNPDPEGKAKAREEFLRDFQFVKKRMDELKKS